MAKHPHRLMLSQKKTWRCTLPNCRWFIHRGLEHTLPGQLATCNGCNEHFTLDDTALEDDQPMCIDCRIKEKGEDTGIRPDLGDYLAVRMALAKKGVKSFKQLNQTQIDNMVALGTLPRNYKKYIDEINAEAEPEDQVEVIEPEEK